MIKFKIFKNESDMIIYSLHNPEHFNAGEPGVVRYQSGRYSPNYLRLLYDHFAGHQEPPFRDPESLKILQVCGIEFLDDHWYSVIVPDPYIDTKKIRLPLTEVGRDLEYALTLLHYSRRGIYLSYLSIEKKIWQALSEMPFDILVAVWGAEIESCIPYFPDEFLIVNYPYCGKEIEVHGKGCIDREDAFFSRLELTEKEGADTSIGFHDPESGLYLGKDGLFYTDIFSAMLALEYYWPNDLREVVRYMTDTLLRDKKFHTKLVRVSDTYTIGEFHQLLQSVQPEMNDSLLGVRDNPEMYHIPALSENFKVVNHLAWMPCPDYYTRAMVVEKQADGTRLAYEHYVCKGIGGLEKLMMDALDMRKKDVEFFCLYLNRIPPLTELGGIKYTICGIRVQWDSLEIFDKDDAWEIFVDELKEMISDA